MKRSDSIAALSAALAKAQGAMEGAKKDSLNPHFKSRYADLASVVEAIKVPLAANGLSYMQFPLTNDSQEVGVETLLSHASGEWVQSDPFFIPVSKADAQGFGSALTYARRYSLAAACGVAPDDDDGNAAAAAKPAPAPRDEVTLQTLRAASLEGTTALKTAWESLPTAKRKECAGELAALKQAAQVADKEAADAALIAA